MLKVQPIISQAYSFQLRNRFGADSAMPWTLNLNLPAPATGAAASDEAADWRHRIAVDDDATAKW
jgi:hypothetical protein